MDNNMKVRVVVLLDNSHHCLSTFYSTTTGSSDLLVGSFL